MARARRLRQKTIVWLAGSGGAATIIAGIFCWDELCYRYHAQRLRSDHRHVARIAGENVGTPANAALDDFLRTRAGKEKLFHCYLSHLAEEIDHDDSRALSNWLAAVTGGRAWYDTSYSGRRLPDGREYCAEHDRFGHLQQLLRRIEGERFFSPDARGYEFSIISVEDATQLYRRSIPASELGTIVFSGAAPFVCRARRIDER